MSTLSAVIAARGGSTRVKNKNIRKFHNSSLLELKIKILKKIKNIEKIYVSSENKKILKLSSKLGAVPIQRDDYYSSNIVSMNEVYKNVVESIPSKHILFVHITSPLIQKSTIENCIKKYYEIIKGKKFDSLATVSELQKFIWFKNKPINYKPSNMPRSQDLPNYYMLNFAINILKKKLILKNKNIVGKNFYPFFLDEIQSFDIDNMIEFKIAEKILSSKLIDINK